METEYYCAMWVICGIALVFICTGLAIILGALGDMDAIGILIGFVILGLGILAFYGALKLGAKSVDEAYKD
jgi:hypothetical protein